MTAEGTKLTRKKEEAIAQLLIQPSVAEAADAVGIAPQTLGRWMRDPAFGTELRAARRAQHRQSLARLRQGAPTAVRSTLQIMYRGTSPAVRLHAAQAVIRMAGAAHEIEELTAEVVAAEVAAAETQAARAGSPPGGQPVHTALSGHGAKFPRRMDEAIAALLEKRNVAEAAGSLDIAVSTLFRWMDQPAFQERYRRSAASVFGSAMVLAQTRMGDATAVCRQLSGDPSVPEATRLRASLFILRHTETMAREDLEIRASVLEPDPVSAGEPVTAEPAVTATMSMTGRILHKKLQEIKARFRQPRGQNRIRMIFAHAIDGRLAGTSVRGPDGGQVWLDPPGGSKAGEPVEKEPGPRQDEAA
jgi:hypothetical protein